MNHSQYKEFLKGAERQIPPSVTDPVVRDLLRHLIAKVEYEVSEKIELKASLREIEGNVMTLLRWTHGETKLGRRDPIDGKLHFAEKFNFKNTSNVGIIHLENE